MTSPNGKKKSHKKKKVHTPPAFTPPPALHACAQALQRKGYVLTWAKKVTHNEWDTSTHQWEVIVFIPTALQQVAPFNFNDHIADWVIDEKLSGTVVTGGINYLMGLRKDP